MRRRRIIVMGFMGSCPIAGVIWQHLHYIVGLQRLGHEVYYVEDSARYPYNPINFDTSDNCTYAVEILRDLSRIIRFSRSLGVLCALSRPYTEFRIASDTPARTLSRG